VRVETGHGYTRGQTVVDRRTTGQHPVHGPDTIEPTLVDVAVHVDARGYAALWLDTLTG
jgi:inosine-uridine nucleoside N-ribohydrolase